MSGPLTRRSLARLLGAAAGATLLEAPRIATAATAASSPASGPIRLSANENPYGPSAPALAALRDSGGAASRYPGAVRAELRERLARLHGVEPDQIALGCGSSDVLRMADAAFLGPDRKIVAAEPTFEAVLGYAKVTRAEAVKVPLTADFRHDLPAMAAACDASTGLVYVCNPNNPTGTIVGGDDLAAFLARVPPSAIVLVDEAYHHFVEDPRYRTAIDLLPRFPNLVVARTFSKIYGMAGLRVGYAVGSEANVETMGRYASWSSVNCAALAGALVSLSDADHVVRQRRLFNETRRWACGELEKQGRRVIPSETNFFMVEIGSDVGPLAQAFRSRGILVGRRFPSMSGWLRVSVGKREEMQRFLAAFREIAPGKAA